ncbi:MAG: hypothetical protein A3J65_00705 [Candidatus Buchananbacteria bacterium RIFCSPHIGHO2_02_FULL_45_11b]|uniref:Uncharacterized protein n=4 Tax=Candidatus Buchananiibacteriota TaxID=1817903 RepID=A0A1G1Y8A6_9BACT|nr:MAG: hypothetical protein A2663_02075 [Candidatus Buchananbacteria bacterium RIFCSPHIGHO2_01_FULL_46_12]OGY52378.1 MAG: hypothetical protein A3J65_00705 [Candidatus Buchananbacteria bacterium RIFCSPHIGHO2_02_FULL_45_11b]OGY53216.1 MAG: hypothetical protein A3B15_02960 [Candidatus Buchananbacteria bacterium RIFCSPLOWO2_01_FULL_45_31]OGY56098.1 MAG: hypothetical protein A3H67_04640 [Candidatus Buchananbacteria bacterium RIFCSPLOWO2_02_FULL_46_11b]
MSKDIIVNSLKYVAFNLIGDFLYWPVWWYTAGLYKAGIFCLGQIKDQAEVLGVGVWLKNIFTPMYGQYDWEGRLISFFVRLAQSLVRLILLLVWIVMIFLIFLAWIILPLLIIFQIVLNFLSLFG